MSAAQDEKITIIPVVEGTDAKAVEADLRTQGRVIIRAYSKAIVLYPTMVAAFLCALLVWIMGPDQNAQETIGNLFFCVFFLNMLMLAFEFPRMTAVALVAGIAAIGFALLWLNNHIGVFEFLRKLAAQVHLLANAQLYLFIGSTLLLVFSLSWVITRFDYWEVLNNEVLHHHGPFGDVERFPAPQLRLDKEIPDIFEYFVLRSGRLVLYPTSEKRAIILDNVLRVNRVEKRLKELLEALEVRVAPIVAAGQTNAAD
jgi:hypothetical protein